MVFKLVHFVASFELGHTIIIVDACKLDQKHIQHFRKPLAIRSRIYWFDVIELVDVIDESEKSMSYLLLQNIGRPIGYVRD